MPGEEGMQGVPNILVGRACLLTLRQGGGPQHLHQVVEEVQLRR